VGRDLTLHKARTSEDVNVAGALVELAGRFERTLIKPGSFAVLLAACGLRSPATIASLAPAMSGFSCR